MDDPYILPNPDDAGRTFWRIIGWGGALTISLLVWAAVFWLVGQGLDRQQDCLDGAATAASCRSPDEA
jgi:hypothetical protein